MAEQSFHKLPREERLKQVAERAKLTPEEAALLSKEGPLDLATAERMIENVIGTAALPLGIATNFRVNSRDLLIPMALEEPSVVAGASNAAKLALPQGFTCSADEPVMTGQVQLVRVPDIAAAHAAVAANSARIIDLCNQQDSTLVRFGGGAKAVETKAFPSPAGPMLIVALHIDVRDAMGANAVNTMAERCAPLLEQLTGGQARLRIISNLADKRKARAQAVWTAQALEGSVKGALPGSEVVDRILEAYYFALADPYRCATHNKGVMNGIDAVAIACGQDFRALEAGAHAYAARGSYAPLTNYSKNSNGDLVGSIELPMAVATVGGSTRTNPVAKLCLKILNPSSAQEFAQVMAAVGLAQNFAALRALATEGISRGHLKLHARNLAIAAGAQGAQADSIAAQMVAENAISHGRAKELLEKP